MEATDETPTVMPTLAEQVEALAAPLALDTDAVAAVSELAAQLGVSAITEESVRTLAQMVNRDEDLRNAEAQGYLRGRNEKIEATQHFDTTPPDETPPAPMPFPAYRRRSVWD